MAHTLFITLLQAPGLLVLHARTHVRALESAKKLLDASLLTLPDMPRSLQRRFVVMVGVGWDNTHFLPHFFLLLRDRLWLFTCPPPMDQPALVDLVYMGLGASQDQTACLLSPEPQKLLGKL